MSNRAWAWAAFIVGMVILGVLAALDKIEAMKVAAPLLVILQAVLPSLFPPNPAKDGAP